MGFTGISNRQLVVLPIYALSHLLVDLASVAVLFLGFARGSVPASEMVAYFLFYNLLAFGLQPMLGYVCDGIREPRTMATTGVLLVFLGLAIVSFSYTAALLLVGIGNALFHVGAGVMVLNMSPGKASLVGLFVAPGALGVYLGTMLGQTDSIFLNIVMLLLPIFFVLIYLLRTTHLVIYDSPDKSFEWRSLSLLFLLLVVASRSFVGFAINYSWKQNLWLGIFFIISIVLGKSVGGLLADRFSLRSVGVTSLVLSIPLLLLGERFFVLGMLGILLFNITMPITLVAIVKLFRGYPGFAFGLTCLGLLVGSLPKILLLPDLPVWFLVVAIAVSAWLLSTALKGSKQVDKKER